MKLYNTLTRQVDEIKPQKPPEVSVYTCGPTVYDYPHIGNWFTFVRYDVLIRTLKAAGLKPKWVMNITDVGHLVSDADEGEDKLEKGARREGKSAWDVAKFYGDYFMDGLKRLNVSQPDFLPKATGEIPGQIDLIKKLEEKGYTYTISDGVYFDTSKFKTYADFARLDLDKLREGARVEANPEKRNPTDFALWKLSPAGQKRDMEWDSPWGKGFPGWHLECSVMSMKYLGETIDIHGGGIDHIPVHHTNEIAQSEAATGKPFAKYWFHSNFILVDNKKMAKSSGGFFTLEDIEAKGFSPQVFRLLVLESHYRTEAHFSWDALEAAKNRLADFQAFADLTHQPDDNADTLDHAYFEDLQDIITSALANDLNTPEALRIISEATGRVAQAGGLNPANQAGHADFLEFLDDALGLGLSNRENITKGQWQILNSRQQARDDKDFAKSDELRDQLKEQGIGVRDTSSGQVWFRL